MTEQTTPLVVTDVRRRDQATIRIALTYGERDIIIYAPSKLAQDAWRDEAKT